MHLLSIIQFHDICRVFGFCRVLQVSTNVFCLSHTFQADRRSLGHQLLKRQCILYNLFLFIGLREVDHWSWAVTLHSEDRKFSSRLAHPCVKVSLGKTLKALWASKRGRKKCYIYYFLPTCKHLDLPNIYHFSWQNKLFWTLQHTDY